MMTATLTQIKMFFLSMINSDDDKIERRLTAMSKMRDDMQKKKHDEKKTEVKESFKCEKNFIIQLSRRFH